MRIMVVNECWSCHGEGFVSMADKDRQCMICKGEGTIQGSITIEELAIKLGLTRKEERDVR